MSREDNDERRLYQCARKYEKIVKQMQERSCSASEDIGLPNFVISFDELIEMMKARTRPPKHRRRVSSNSKGNSTATAPPSEPDKAELVQTLTQFLKELQSDQATVSDCLTSTPEE